MKKQHSIKSIVTFCFVAIFAAIIVALNIFSNFFMEIYYRSEKVRMLGVAYDTINKLVAVATESDTDIFSMIIDGYDSNQKDNSVVSVFRVLNEHSNIDIAMMSSDGTKRAATSRESDWLLMKLDVYRNFFNEYTLIPDVYVGESETDTDGTDLSEGTDESGTDSLAPWSPTFFDYNEDTPLWSYGLMGSEQQYQFIDSTENYIIQTVEDSRSDSKYVECFGIFSDGDTFFLMSMPIANITEGVSVSMRFLLFSSIVTLIIGSLLMYFAANMITKPVIKLSKLSDNMARLDFSNRYNSKDYNMGSTEINDLGNSMNYMADTIEAYINELNAANAQLQKDIEEKIKIDEVRKEFIANVSHELKTPIALIEGYAEGLVDGLAEEKEVRDYYCNVIIDETVKMNRLVRDLTSLISYEFGNNAPDLTEFNLTELILSVTDSLKLKFEEKEVDLSLDLLDKVTVTADEFKIEEVYTNYINNALNHLSGGKIIRVRMEDSNDMVTVYVYNDGKNIPEESLPHLWEKFYKVDKARTRAYGGSGIGLSIVKAIMDSHNGSCGVVNKDNGVEFYFSLPKKLDCSENV